MKSHQTFCSRDKKGDHSMMWQKSIKEAELVV